MPATTLLTCLVTTSAHWSVPMPASSSDRRAVLAPGLIRMATIDWLTK